MSLVPSLLADGYGYTGPQSALVIVFAMLANWGGAMLIVATRLRNVPTIALPIAAAAAAFMGFTTVTGAATSLPLTIACVLLFTATIGTANALVWSLLPAAVPSPEAGGATAGLVTQGSFLGVLIGPPTFFAIRHENPLYLAALAAFLAVLMMTALIAHFAARRRTIDTRLPASSH
jgi:hypothetical protein